MRARKQSLRFYIGLLGKDQLGSQGVKQALLLIRVSARITDKRITNYQYKTSQTLYDISHKVQLRCLKKNESKREHGMQDENTFTCHALSKKKKCQDSLS